MPELPLPQIDNAAVVTRFRLYGLGWVPVGTLLMILHSSLMQMLFAYRYNPFAPVYLIFITYSFLTALFVWACVRFLNPALARSSPSTPAPRMVAGLEQRSSA